MEAMLESDHYDEWGEVPEVAVVIIIIFFFSSFPLRALELAVSCIWRKQVA